MLSNWFTIEFQETCQKYTVNKIKLLSFGSVDVDGYEKQPSSQNQCDFTMIDKMLGDVTWNP